MTWKIKDEYKENHIIFDINALSENDLKIVKEIMPDLIDKYFIEQWYKSQELKVAQMKILYM